MNPIRISIAMALILVPTFAWPQGLVPTMESQFEFCEDRPLQPEWMDNLSVREAYRGLVIQTIYRAQSVERVVEAGECSCSTRFPPWHAAVQHFNDRYLGSDRNGLREANRQYLNRFNELRQQARAVCEIEGHW